MHIQGLGEQTAFEGGKAVGKVWVGVSALLLRRLGLAPSCWWVGMCYDPSLQLLLINLRGDKKTNFDERVNTVLQLVSQVDHSNENGSLKATRLLNQTPFLRVHADREF